MGITFLGPFPQVYSLCNHCKNCEFQDLFCNYKQVMEEQTWKDLKIHYFNTLKFTLTGQSWNTIANPSYHPLKPMTWPKYFIHYLNLCMAHPPMA